MFKKLGMRWGSMVSFVGVSLLAVSGTAFAAGDTPPVFDGPSLGKLFCNIINWMIWILLAVAIIMIIIAAFQYVTAGDDTEKTTKGRKTLTYAAIGIAVVLLAKGFPLIVASVFPNSVSATSFTCGAGSNVGN